MSGSDPTSQDGNDQDSREVYDSINHLTNNRAVEVNQVTDEIKILEDRNSERKWSVKKCSKHGCLQSLDFDTGKFVCPICADTPRLTKEQ